VRGEHVSAEEIIAELQRVAGMVNSNTVSVSQFNRHGRITVTRVARTFGSWNHALEAAGLEPTTKYKGIPQNEVISELQRVAQELGQPTLSRSKFLFHSKLSPQVAERKFGSWSAAVKAAGLIPLAKTAKIPDQELEAEFMRVYNQVGRVPTFYEFRTAARFSPETYASRWGSWRKTVAHYLGPEAPAVVTRPPEEHKPPTPAKPKPRPWHPTSTFETGKARWVFGAPLNFKALQHEPVNEQGVVVLFGMVAGEMGFLIDAIRSDFPDCRAKRRTKRGYVDAVIEFEFRSSEFRNHGHDPAECDLVVCWENDWPDCPVEVLELKSAIRQLDANV